MKHRDRRRRLGSWLPGAIALALACASTPPLPEPRESGQLVFWEVNGDEGGGRAWLLGSLHFGKEEHAYDPAIDRAFDASEALVMEVDPASMNDAAALRIFLERALLAEDLTLADVLSEEAYAQLDRALAARGQSLFLFERMKPWVVMMILTNQRILEQGYRAEKGVDAHFHGRADGKLPVLGLEQLEDQLAVFDEMPFALQERVLVEMLEYDGDAVSTELLARAWHLGDLDALEAMVLADHGTDPDLDATYESIYFRRNRQMTDRLATLLEDEGSYFVVVGTGHMLGTQGIPALLAERGFTVRRVPRSP
jgi:uncharacterized protein